MAPRIRQQTQADYAARVKRVNKAFGQRFKQAPSGRSHIWAVIGFLWFYVVVTIATRKADIIQSLEAGNLPHDAQNLVLAVMAVLLGVSLVLLAFHSLQVVLRTHARRTSGGLVFGAVAAMGLILIPPSVWRSGYALLDDNTRLFVAETQNSVRNIDWSDVVLVSSQSLRITE